MTSAFSKAAPAITDSVSGVFGIATANPTSVKAGVVLGISALEGQSFGNDATLSFKPAALNM